MELEQIGKERGKRKIPPSDSVGFDEVEARIIERIEAEKKRAHGVLEDERRTYAERGAALDLEGRFSLIQQIAPACIGAFRAEVGKGLDELHGRRRHLKELETEREDFRRTHGLRRVARTHSGATAFLKWAFLGLLLIVESVLNGNFLAKGNELGLIGGITQAIGFAFLNVGAAVVLATTGVRQLNHRSAIRKTLGILALAFFVAFALALNLAMAHYREVAGVFGGEGGREVVLRLIEAPFSLNDIVSWIFFGIGLLFAVFAFIDGLFLFDPYPGYGDVQKRLDQAHHDYIDRKAELVDELQSIRDQYTDDIEEVRRDLSVRRAEFDSILAARSRIAQLFEQHQMHLERAVNTLLAVYRDANTTARKTDAPERFSKPYVLERVEIPMNLPEEPNPADAEASVRAAQEVLSEQGQAIHTEFEQAVAKYRQLDDLVPDDGHGAEPA